MSDPVDLAALRALHEKATPGPWICGSPYLCCTKTTHGQLAHPGPRGDDPCVYTFQGWHDVLEGYVSVETTKEELIGADDYGQILSREDAASIVALHNVFPALADELDHLRAIASAARQYVEVRDDPNAAQVVGTAWRHLCDMLETS